MVTNRLAADPGIIARVVGFLGENPITQGWSDAVGNTANYIERRVGSEDELRHHLAAIASRLGNGSRIDPAQLELLERLKGAPVNRELLEAIAAEQGVEEAVGGQVVAQAIANAVPAQLLRNELAALQTPQSQRGEYAHAVTTLARHPLVAYGAIGGGGALGTLGAMELYQMMQERGGDQGNGKKKEDKKEKAPPEGGAQRKSDQDIRDVEPPVAQVV